MKTAGGIVLCGCLLCGAATSQTVGGAPDDGAGSFWWGDFDGDALEDAFVISPAGEARLLRNVGDGLLLDVTETAGLAGIPAPRLAAWQDFDGDGVLDLFVGTGVGASLLFRGLGEGAFEEVGSAVGLAHAGLDLHAGWLDYDRDGRPDLHVRTAEQGLLYHNLGEGLFEPLDLGLAAGTPPKDPMVATGSAAAKAEPRGAPEPGGEESGASDKARRVTASLVTADPLEPFEQGGRVEVGGLPPGGTLDATPFPACAKALKDQAGGCLYGSSTPKLGMLYPLSPDLFVDLAGRVGMGTITPSHQLTVVSSSQDALRLLGPGPLGEGARLDWGDLGRVHLVEDVDDSLKIESTWRTSIMGGNVGIHTLDPDRNHALHVAGDTLLQGGVLAEETDTAGPVVLVENPAATGNPIGLHALATGASRTAVGVRGEVTSETGIGVEGVNSSSVIGGTGVHGIALNAAGTGVHGHSTQYGTGVLGTVDGSGYGVRGKSPEVGVKGNGGYMGVVGQSNEVPLLLIFVGNGYGVVGWDEAPSGFTYGVHGFCFSPDGTGVDGIHAAATGTGAGVAGFTASADSSAIGVLGHVSPSASPGPFSAGVKGENRGADSTSCGVWGDHAGGGIGVYGTSADFTGVRGEYTGTTPLDVPAVQGHNYLFPYFGYGGDFMGGWIGVSASALGIGPGSRYGGWFTASGGDSSIYGVYAEAYDLQSDGEAVAVYGGTLPADGYAGYFQGNAHVTGTLTDGAAALLIDHPLDPGNRTLAHAFVASPEMTNVYSGNILLDASGGAWVELPEWFEALNRDLRYQLTPIGAPAPMLHVAQPVEAGSFRIAGGPARAQVSWQVTGVRRDPYAEANRISVEELKRPKDRGLFLHPEAWGQPPERGVGHAEREEQRKKLRRADELRASRTPPPPRTPRRPAMVVREASGTAPAE